MESKFANSNDHDTAFITLQRERSFDDDSKKRTTHYQKEVSQIELYDTKNSSKGFNDRIAMFENFI